MVNFLCLGDVVGRPGRSGLRQGVKTLREKYAVDFVIANGENAAGGLGIDGKVAEEIHSSGVDVITLGDHAWQKKDARLCLDMYSDWLIRPANYPPGAPGKGCAVLHSKEGVRVGVLNLQGRVFMNGALDCPFRVGEQLLREKLAQCQCVVCDIHAEATSEKNALGRYFDGRISLMVGTHTHVQTADEQVLPGGTGYISDLGMCGSLEGVIGMDCRVAIDRFISGIPSSYEIASGPPVLQGIVAEVDPGSGKTLRIERVRYGEAT